ncbi:uncharacterized protein [Fopius arisanus]|uniref:Uncharacterized protein isoform X2 n=1 Tax=Fopius arisanus TaxID=64838 RepID=A0A9R1SU72_9HYME|nr:PREDICTED: uncharacterized protein LOC105262999 isoform X2 [Fopius arisanus]XP_011297244.1 PREDICTED: uncharacterized protein LOC105262999 isoform X2 [Fopius arisanus]
MLIIICEAQRVIGENFSEERRRTGRYLAGGAALAVTLLVTHHVLLKGASAAAGICIPAIFMTCYLLWVIYTVRRDRAKARRLAAAMQLTEVISTSSSRPQSSAQGSEDRGTLT